MTTRRAMGRPKKISTEAKLEIVTRYYLTQDESLRNHGIYRKLSDYAKSLGFSLEAHDFSRDPAVRGQIEKLASHSQKKNSISEEPQAERPLPSYIPLDIPALMNHSWSTMAETLAEREQYFEALHLKAAYAIEDYNTLFEEARLLREEVNRLQAENEALASDKKTLKLELHDEKIKVSYLTRVIKKDVEPEKAHQFLQSLTTQDKVVEAVQKTIYHTLDTLCRDDRQMHKDAIESIDKADLINLFR